MRLSEAIRLGAMLKPQAFGRMFSDDGRSCALGAAIEAIGLRDSYPHNWTHASAPVEWHWAKRAVDCPTCAGLAPAHIVISHLNDEHRWTREQIADWVETIEREQVAKAGEATTPVCEPVLP